MRCTQIHINMKTNYLFPVVCRKIGWWLFFPFFILGIYCLFGDGSDQLSSPVFALLHSEGFGIGHQLFKLIYNPILDELTIIGLTVALLFIAFSKEKDEDECVEHIRLQSLVWSIMWSYGILIFATVFFYGFAFMDFVFANLFTVLFLFIIRYNWKLYQFRRLPNE